MAGAPALKKPEIPLMGSGFCFWAQKCFNISHELCISQVELSFDKCAQAESRTTVKTSEVEAVSKEIGRCTSRDYVASKKPLLRLSSDCRSLAGQTGNKPENVDGVAKEYDLERVADSDSMKMMETKIATSPKSICPAYKGSDHSTCLKSSLNALELKSSIQIMALTSFVTTAYLEDKKLGYSKSIAGLMLADNLLLILERVDLSRFHLAKIQAKSPSEKTNLLVLKSDDEKLISETIVKKILPLIEARIEDAKQGRDPASIQQWKTSQISALQKRLATLRGRSFKYEGK
jgi:hypothetical protein